MIELEKKKKIKINYEERRFEQHNQTDDWPHMHTQK